MIKNISALKADLAIKINSLKNKKKEIYQNQRNRFKNDYSEANINEAFEYSVNYIYSKLPKIVDELDSKHSNQITIRFSNSSKDDYIQGEVLKIAGNIKSYYRRDWLTYTELYNEMFQSSFLESITAKYLEEQSLLNEYSPLPFPRENRELRQLFSLIEAELELILLRLLFEENREKNEYLNIIDNSINNQTFVKEKPSRIKTNTLWFQSGILFANGTMDKYWNKNYTDVKDIYSIPLIAKEVNAPKAEKYFLASFKGYSNDKNIFNDIKKMKFIIEYLQQNNNAISPYFLDSYKLLSNKF